MGGGREEEGEEEEEEEEEEVLLVTAEIKPSLADNHGLDNHCPLNLLHLPPCRQFDPPSWALTTIHLS